MKLVSVLVLIGIAVAVAHSGIGFNKPQAGEKYYSIAKYEDPACAPVNQTYVTYALTGCQTFSNENVLIQCTAAGLVRSEGCDATCSKCVINQTIPLNSCEKGTVYNCLATVPTIAATRVVELVYNSNTTCTGDWTELTVFPTQCVALRGTRTHEQYKCDANGKATVDTCSDSSCASGCHTVPLGGGACEGGRKIQCGNSSN